MTELTDHLRNGEALSETKGTATPRHLWIVGIAALLWTLLGAMDYLMLETRNAWYASYFTQEQLEHGYGYPAWLVAFWAIAAWGGVLGAVLLLMRKRLAVSVLLLSCLCWVVWAIKLGVADDIGLAVPFALTLAMFIYASSMARKRVLA